MSKKSNWEVFMNGFGVYKNEKTGSVERSWIRTLLEAVGIIGTSAGGGYAAGEMMDGQGGFGATIGAMLGSIFTFGRETEIRSAMHGYNKDVTPPKKEDTLLEKLMAKLAPKKEPTLEEKILEKLGLGEKKEEDTLLEKLAAKLGLDEKKKEDTLLEKLAAKLGAGEKKEPEINGAVLGMENRMDKMGNRMDKMESALSAIAKSIVSEK